MTDVQTGHVQNYNICFSPKNFYHS